MNVYALPLERPVYGRNAVLAQRSTQKVLYLKYTTVIKALLAGITADVLRMRLKQAADASFMSVKNYLDCKQVEIILALKDNRSHLLLVYPPYELSPDLARWSTRLLCLVLRACNCLSVREQSDVIFLAKTYRRYFGIKRQSFGSGIVTKRGSLAKREWFKVCSTVQRMVEAVDDARLLKAVRNFICTVEMETKTTKARHDTQFRLESLVQELVAGNPFSRYRDENMTDEAKQIARGRIIRRTQNVKQTNIQRPHSAGARLTRVNNSDHNFDTPNRNVSHGTTRPATACDPRYSSTFPMRKVTRDRLSRINNPEFDNPRHTKDTEIKNSSEDTKARMTKRPSSATERNKKISTSLLKKRPQSARNHRQNIAIRVTSDNAVQNLKQKDEKRMITEKKTENVAKARPSSGRSAKQTSARQHENAEVNVKVSVKRPNTTKRMKSSRERQSTRNNPVKTPKQENDFIDLSEKTYTENGRRVRHKTVMYIEKLKPSQDNNTKHDERPKGGTNNKACKENKTRIKGDTPKDRKVSENYVPNIIRQEMGKDKDKRKVYDDNMKKIANEVLVHQQIHIAAKNPLLQNKEFVDELFSFLNENQVTKKFLRAQSTESNQSWKLPNGRRANFSFFLAFVFRHIDNKDRDMVCYVVEKMLIRMKCKHNRRQKKKSLSTTREDQRKSKGESSMLAGFGNVESQKSSGKQSVPRERSSTSLRDCRAGSRSSEVSRRSRSEHSEASEEKPRVYRSTSITNNQCWKCLQKDVAMTACVNWGNRSLCDLLVSKGVPYKEEHLSAAVKANDMVTLVNIVDYLIEYDIWNPKSKDSMDALYLANKLGMRQMVTYLNSEGVKDERIVNHNACTTCFIA